MSAEERMSAAERASAEVKDFAVNGINHLALVCSNMQRTVDFYSGKLGFPLIKTVELPGGAGQHFFFDIGGGNHLAFFWFSKATAAAPGVSAPVGMPGIDDITSAIGSMNHVAFNIPLEKFDEYRDRLIEKGIKTGVILNHDDSPSTVAREMHPGVFVRSLYFMDPDGIVLEFACYTKELTAADVRHEPAGEATISETVTA